MAQKDKRTEQPAPPAEQVRISEGVRAELALHGHATDPATGRHLIDSGTPIEWADCPLCRPPVR
jgi:hypothetical protein